MIEKDLVSIIMLAHGLITHISQRTQNAYGS